MIWNSLLSDRILIPGPRFLDADCSGNGSALILVAGLGQLLAELEDFLFILDKENLSSTAVLKKSSLSELLQGYIRSNSSCDEEYIYMNKVLETDKKEAQGKQGKAEVLDPPANEALTNGTAGQYLVPPQKSLPDLPPPKIITDKLPGCKCDSPEGYYEEAEPYNASFNDDGEAVSSSYESYDEDEGHKGKGPTQQHQWPSTEASIELMKDSLICAFLWRKKWLGQWAKQLCVVKDSRLLIKGISSRGVSLCFCAVKKKVSSGLKLSNLMNLGRKKSTSLESPEKALETSNYLNVLINSQWKSRYCCVMDGQLHFYQDRNKTKAAAQPVSLIGCDVIPQPTQDHLYSFRILQNGEELATLEAKSSEDMGHWLGLLLLESGSRTDPEDFSYDYVDADRVSCIVSAAKNSYFLMQRKYSEPNTYIDAPRGGRYQQDDLYDDVDVSDIQVAPVPVAVLFHSQWPYCSIPSGRIVPFPVAVLFHSQWPFCSIPSGRFVPFPVAVLFHSQWPYCSIPSGRIVPFPVAVLFHSQWPYFSIPSGRIVPFQWPYCSIPVAALSHSSGRIVSFQWPYCFIPVAIETLLGKNRTEAEIKRFAEEKEKLEKEREEIRVQLAQLRKERREMKESVTNCTDKGLLANLEDKLRLKEDECKERERDRVDLELKIVEVKENLRKAELGPATLGTTVEPAHLDPAPSIKSCSPVHVPECSPVTATIGSPVNSATALKSRPQPIVTTGKGTVLQKAKEWEKKGAS
eukprot:XP_017945303.1 PREDICTED: actin filament-associated protein 1-like 2 [Xenopus tropicalis]